MVLTGKSERSFYLEQNLMEHIGIVQQFSRKDQTLIDGFLRMEMSEEKSKGWSLTGFVGWFAVIRSFSS